jgi:type II secretory pathway component PulF
MEAATLDDFMAWNDELYALAEAGVPIDVDLARAGTDTLGALERINATIARRVSQGASLTEALEATEPFMTRDYCSLMQLGLHSGNIGTGLTAATRRAESLDDSWQIVRFAMFYPVIVCGLAYVGMISFCLLFVPTLENLYRSLQIRPGAGLHVLQAIRETLPYWIAVPPLALVLWLGSRMIFPSKRGLSQGRTAQALAWLPGMSRVIDQQRYASFAETLAALLEAGTPLPKALGLAVGTCGQGAMAESVRALAASLNQGAMLSDESRLALRIPPFLRYALWHSEETIGRGRALHMAASFYRESARRYVERMRLVAPLVACVLLGGGVTLLYALALFVPVVEMLGSLAS